MPPFQSCKIAFIGGGNMATAIISGLVSTGITPLSNITVSEPVDAARAKLAALGIHTTTSNATATADADIVVIAVKPPVTSLVCAELAAAWATRSSALPTVLSIAAGITLASLCDWLRTPDGRVAHIVRAMPNTPALVGQGAAGVFARPEVTEEERQLVGTLLGSICHATEWVSDEGMLDVVTGLSGSGPAYFFLMVEHLISSAMAHGMPREQATRLASQTCYGAGKMLVESVDSPARLRENVTSPNGTTHAALVTFDALGFKDIVEKSVKAAVDRSVELGKPSS